MSLRRGIYCKIRSPSNLKNSPNNLIPSKLNNCNFNKNEKEIEINRINTEKDSAGSVSSNNRENFPDKLDIISIITTRSDETENYCVHNLNRKDRKNSTIREVIIPKIDYMYRRPALFSLSKKVKSLPFFEVKQNRKHFFGLKLEWISSRLIVVSIEKGTRAERCGINIGDELLELNGYVITTQLSKRAINNIFNLSQEVKLKIKDGQGKYLTIHKDQYSKKVSLGLRLSKRKVNTIVK
jgi:C-terminal processing protease CtpA/Prc